MRLVVTLCLLSSLVCATRRTAFGNEASYLSFEVTGAIGTYPMSINSSMAVTGYYYVSSTVTGGFVREPDGEITTFSVRDGVWTEPESINDAGDITGYYEVVSGVPHGFVRYADGRIVTFDPPCDESVGPCGIAFPVSINALGEIAGNFPFLAGYASAGFTRSPGGVFTLIRYSTGADYPTALTGINASGTTVGYCFSCYPDNDYGNSSFFSHPDGFFTEFSAVSSEEQISSETTIAEGINDDGVIAGWYSMCTNRCMNSSTGGFVRSPQGVFTLFNPPGTMVAPPGPDLFDQGNPGLSAPRSLCINQEGTIAGSYTDTGGAQHGFVRNPYGTITSFDPPRGRQTTATSINDSGVIAGSYFDDWNTQTAQGFLRIPKP